MDYKDPRDGVERRANYLADQIFASLKSRQGVLDGIDDDTLEEIRTDFYEFIITSELFTLAWQYLDLD